MSLKNLLKDLPRKYIIQCNRNIAVNRRFIKYADRVNQVLKLRNGKEVKIGGKMKKGFFEEL